MTVSASDLILDRIDRQGPLPLSEVLAVALYHPQFGFYERGGSAGRRDGDFLTSPEVGALFGAVLARALDAWWGSMGRPDPFLVVEAGAGPGTLARTVLAAEPECGPALRYVLVERSATQRARHDRLPLEDPSLVLPPVDPHHGDPAPEAPPGPMCVSLADLPRVPEVPKVVLANELLDNLPFDLAELRDGTWYEVRVGAPAVVGDGSGPAGAGASDRREEPSFTEVLVPLAEARASLLGHLAPNAPEGARLPIQDQATEWLRDALETAGDGGRVVVFDYGARSTELVTRAQDTWLRTYRGHGRGSGYLEALGLQDVTCEVAIDQLSVVRQPSREQAQSDWLPRYGLDSLVVAARRVWDERAPVGDLRALKARSRVNEGSALADPTGLGAFCVLEWEV